jgi:hypothetical protein
MKPAFKTKEEFLAWMEKYGQRYSERDKLNNKHREEIVGILEKVGGTATIKKDERGVAKGFMLVKHMYSPTSFGEEKNVEQGLIIQAKHEQHLAELAAIYKAEDGWIREFDNQFDIDRYDGISRDNVIEAVKLTIEIMSK